MNYSWVIDQRKCIGCHACTTACKSENEVPLSVDRTWVKYVEKGTFPNVQRHFGVLRCNHCANPPCVEICPVTAMFQRPDGIVEFDKDVCIGCKACIAACPYDAIYIDPDNGTAAKCNFCAHRLDVGLEPACVVVCPEEALIFGDLDDPTSKVSQLIGREKTQVRKPEKNTDPKCFYIGADESVLNPDVQTHDESGMYMWSLQREEKHGAKLDPNKPSGMSLSAALNAVTGAKVAYDVHHDIPWAQYVSLYLWTKSIAAGTFLMTWLVLVLHTLKPEVLFDLTWIYWLGPVIALIGIGLTGLFLIADLDRPERFWLILARPQWKSWLAIGAYIITVFTGLLVVDLALYFFAPPAAMAWLTSIAYHLTMPFAVMTAIYTAFLFAQAKGRDLWQSPMLPFHLFVQAMIAGSGIIGIACAVLGDRSPVAAWSSLTLLFSLITHFFLVTVGEVMTEHSSKAKQRAVHLMVKGPYSKLFWGGGVAFGTVLPIVLLQLVMAGIIAVPVVNILPIAGICAILGLLAYEHCFVMAGQSIRLS